jgi:hypothetical protein
MRTELLTAVRCMLILLYPEVGDRECIRKVYTHLRGYKTSHSRTLINQQDDILLND